ncbi:MAG TPA: FUSC family protein [Steroidobacteraceae bacterium]
MRTLLTWGGNPTHRWRTMFDAGALRRTMSASIPGLIFGLRLSASVCLALYIAFWLQLDGAYWAGTSAGIVCQPTLGASLRKGWYRMIGTVVGAAMIVVLTAYFIQNRAAFLVALALWGAGCALVATLLRNFASYAAALAGYTAAIIASDELGATGGPDAQSFMLAVDRATEICIGIVSAGIILALTDFGGARRRLALLMAPLAAEIAGRFAGTLAASGPERPDTQPVRRELIQRVIALDPAIDQAIGESSQLRYRSPLLQRAVDGLFGALAGWRAVANHLVQLPRDRQSQQEVGEVLQRIPRKLSLEYSDPRWLANPVGMRRICRQAVRALLAVPVRTPSLRLLIGQTTQVLLGVSEALNGLALLVADPARHRAHQKGFRFYVADWVPALVNAARTLITLGAVELFWILTGWPSGAAAITWAAIPVVLFGAKADQGFSSARSFFAGCGLATIFAAIVAFAALPQVETFVGFSAVMASFLIPAGALSAQRWQTLLFVAMATNMVPLVAPVNAPGYDTIQFYNSALALFAGTGIAALSFLLVPPLSPAFRTRRLLALTLWDLRRLAGRPIPQSSDDWARRVYARLSTLPDAALPLERAQLIAALSAGTEVIQLHRIVRRLDLASGLEPALKALAQGHSTLASEELARLDQTLARMPKAGRALRLALRARGNLLALSEVLAQHSLYFDAGVSR